MTHTPVDPAIELRVREIIEEEREKSNDLYAIKLVERVVFGQVALILITVLTAIVALVVAK